MGQLKALLPWRGTTLMASQLTELRSAGLDPIVAVLGHRADDLRRIAEGGGARIVLNRRYREGKSTSIVAGVAAVPNDAEAALIVAVDQPCRADVLTALIRAHDAAKAGIVLPSIHHRRGHPTLFDRSLFPDLLAISEERFGLREVMERHAADIHYVEVEDEIVRANLNSPDHYQAAYERWGKLDQG